jgi:hypothetical protein
MISNAIKRSILRWLHLLFAIPIIGYIYSPFSELPNYSSIVRHVAFPSFFFQDSGCMQAYSLPLLALRRGWLHTSCFDTVWLS